MHRFTCRLFITIVMIHLVSCQNINILDKLRNSDVVKKMLNDTLEESINRHLSKILENLLLEDFSNDIENGSEFIERLETVESNVVSIHNLFTEILSESNTTTISDEELDSIKTCLILISDSVAPSYMETNMSVFQDIHYFMSKDERLSAMLEMSEQQVKYSLLKKILAAELKAYVLLTANVKLEEINAQNTTELNSTRQFNFVEQIDIIRKLYKKASADDDAMIWKMDPEIHKADETYIEIKKLLQGFITNAPDLGAEQCSAGSGRKPNCKNRYPCDAPCQGKVYECATLNRPSYCLANQDTSLRRYDHFQIHENKNTFGKNSHTCGTVNLYQYERHSLSGNLECCESCFCLCDDINESRTERYFSLKPSIANISRNQVVTGVQLARKNKVIYLRIQVGELIDGHVATTFVVEPQEVDLQTGTEDVDYFKMDYFRRSISLREIYASQNYLVTGVKFNHRKGRLFLEAKLTKVDLESGYLTSESRWKSVERLNQTTLNLEDLDVPILSKTKSRMIPGPSNSLAFTTTSFHRDASQTTIPFLDMQPMFPKVPVPLFGISLYYKASEGFGGFIGVKVYTDTNLAYTMLNKNIESTFEEVDKIFNSSLRTSANVYFLCFSLIFIFILPKYW